MVHVKHYKPLLGVPAEAFTLLLQLHYSCTQYFPAPVRSYSVLMGQHPRGVQKTCCVVLLLCLVACARSQSVSQQPSAQKFKASDSQKGQTQGSVPPKAAASNVNSYGDGPGGYYPEPECPNPQSADAVDEGKEAQHLRAAEGVEGAPLDGYVMRV